MTLDDGRMRRISRRMTRISRRMRRMSRRKGKRGLEGGATKALAAVVVG